MVTLFVEPPSALANVSMGEGNTPLTTIRAGASEVTAKLEFESPTGSFKDRGAAVLVAAAVDLGASHVVADSSGNAGVAIAAYARRAGLTCDVFVAASTPPDKIDHIDGTVHLVEGSREDVAAAAIDHVERTGAFYASHVWNPWFFEGTKHYVLELHEQLGGRLPDALVLPVGNGTLVLGAWRAMQELGVTVPIVGVQAELCAPIADAFVAGAAVPQAVVNRGTAAAGIAIADPVRGAEILEVIGATGGRVATVNEDEIAVAVAQLADQGLDVEPTAAVPLAAATRLDGSEVVVPVSSRRATQARYRSRTH